MDTLYDFGIETLLPLISFDWSPNTSVESFFSLLLVEIFVNVGHNFRYLIEQIDEIILGKYDDFLEYFRVNQPVYKFEVLNGHPYNFCVVLEVYQHLVYLIEDVGLHVQIFEKVVLLDIHVHLFYLTTVT